MQDLKNKNSIILNMEGKIEKYDLIIKELQNNLEFEKRKNEIKNMKEDIEGNEDKNLIENLNNEILEKDDIINSLNKKVEILENEREIEIGVKENNIANLNLVFLFNIFL